MSTPGAPSAAPCHRSTWRGLRLRRHLIPSVVDVPDEPIVREAAPHGIFESWRTATTQPDAPRARTRPATTASALIDALDPIDSVAS